METLFWQKSFVLAGAILGFLGVAIGAFAAHALKQRLSPDLLNVFEIGVRYQMYHALALLIIACLLYFSPSSFLIWAGGFFILGIAIFSGSLYALALSGLKILGAITPIGGVLLLLGWLGIILSVLKI